MRILLDAGALIALERKDQAMWERLKVARVAGEVPLTHAGIVGQVWRGRGPRQALLARALAGIEIRDLDEAMGRASGELLARVRLDDVIDASLVLLANDGDIILTSDPDDLEPLLNAAGLDVDILVV